LEIFHQLRPFVFLVDSPTRNNRDEEGMNSDWMTWALPAVMVGGFLVYKRLGQIAPAKAHELVKSGAKLVDVRSAAEFQSGHLDGAVNIPLPLLTAKASSLGAKELPVVVYCASGTRSALARSALKSQGFTQVFNLGPMHRW
jgi:phage shock protein E